MPLDLDSCITGIFVPGNIGASSGLPPVVRVMPPREPGVVAAAIAETATAVDLQAFVLAVVDAAVVEAASADAAVAAGLLYTAAVVEAATAGAAVAAGSSYADAIVEAATATDTQAGTMLSITGTPATTGTEYEHGVGSTYAGFTVTASGGISPYTYSVASGTLPSGITLNSSTGAVSGTPAFESAGTYSGIVIRATDNIGAIANLASFTLTIAFKDPYYSNVSCLFDYDAANGNTTFTDQKTGTNAAVAGSAQHSTVVTPLYGTSSFLLNGTTDRFYLNDSAAFNLASSNFTIDFTVRPVSVSSTQFWISQWESAGTLGWVFAQSSSATVYLGLSTTGSNSIFDVESSAGTIVANTWARWRVDFNGTKYRLYKNGTMIASSTTLRTINNSNQNLSIGSNSLNDSFRLGGNCRGIRLTLGTARTASDSGYTISNRAFPTS